MVIRKAYNLSEDLYNEEEEESTEHFDTVTNVVKTTKKRGTKKAQAFLSNEEVQGFKN